jgi:hypothetical protein
MGYDDEIFREGVLLAEPHIKSRLLVQSYKNLIKPGRRIPPIRKKLLYQTLLRIAKMTDRLVEKKSEQKTAPPKSPETPETPEPPKEPETPEPPETPKELPRQDQTKKSAAAKEK